MPALITTIVRDGWSYAWGSGLLRSSSASAQAHVLKTAHRIEKGLALPQPRPGFGADAMRQLERDLHQQGLLHGPDWAWFEALRTLNRYRLQQRPLTGAGTQVREATRIVEKWLPPAQTAMNDPILPLTDPALVFTREDLQRQAQGSFEALVRSRRSIRQFAGGVVARGAIEEAVWLASHSPSVCNRSGARVWVVLDAQRRARLLRHQNGNEGFGDAASALLIITVRPEVFHTVEERHQGWIDGGLFAMTLILSLHRQGLGTCCLNWCVTPSTDAQFKREAQLPPHEQVVMLLAVGTLPPTFSVAHSPRRPLHESLHWIDEAPTTPPPGVMRP